MRQEPFKVAFIGGGINSSIGEVHKVACQMDGYFKLVAGAFSTHEQSNFQTAETWGVDAKRCYGDYHELLKNEKGNLDAVVVLTPTPTHKNIVVDCLEAGFPVICEKALAMDVEECSCVAKIAAETNGFLCTTFCYTGYPMVRELKKIIADGALGKIRSVQIEMPQDGFVRKNSDGGLSKPQDWRLHDSKIPMVSLDLGSHLHDMVHFLTGEHPISVVADQSSQGAFPQVVDNVSALARYTNDLKVQFWYGKSALGNRNGFRVRVYGSEGSAEWFQLEPECLKVCDSVGRVRQIDRACDVKVANQPRYNRFKAGHTAGFIEAFANYYADVASGLENFLETGKFCNEYLSGVDESLEGLALMQAAAKSVDSNKWEQV